MADEVEDKTITYLFTRPDPPRGGAAREVPGVSGLHDLRGAAVGRCSCICWSCRCKGSLGGSFIDLLKDLALLALGLAVYGALFAFVGAKFKRPLLIGLIFIFGWEQAALAFPGLPEEVHGRLLPAGAGAARHAERQRRQPHPGHLPGEPASVAPACSGWRRSGFVFVPWRPGSSSAGNTSWSSRPDRVRYASGNVPGFGQLQREVHGTFYPHDLYNPYRGPRA